jgi:Lon-like protease
LVSMTFFNGKRPTKKAARFGIASLLALTLAGLTFMPSGFVIERPGAVFNVMGTLDDQAVISSEDTEIFPSDTQLDITTVSLLGNREYNPNWIQVLIAWLDPEQVVLPLDQVYPPNQTTEQARAESSLQMEVSQQDAIAAALLNMGYEVPRTLYVNMVLEDSPSAGVLVAGDFVESVNEKTVVTFEELKAEIQESKGNEIALGVVRDGKEIVVPITPALNANSYAIGAMIGYTYDFPVDISLQLGDVGGPSGGLIFSLGIIDALTPGSIAGNGHIAGTGTIAADGSVGPIGGIALKMVAAKNAGAQVFLAPVANCSEVVGNIPGGLEVVEVRDLTQALEVLSSFSKSEALPALGCTK